MAGNKSRNTEVLELENAFHNLAEKNAEKKSARYARAVNNRNMTIIIACAVLLVIVIALGGWFLYQYMYDNALITANLTVAGVDVTGMTRAQAIQAVSSAVNEAYLSNTMVVQIDEHEVRIPYSVSGISIDVESAVNAAVEYEQTSPEKKSLDLSAFMTINKDAVMNELRSMSEFYSSTLVQSSFEIVGEFPGEHAEIDASLVLPVLKIFTGKPGVSLDLDDLYQHVIDGFSDAVFRISYSPAYTLPNPIDLEGIYNSSLISPVEAEMNKETFEVTGGYYGFDFDMEAAQRKLERCNYGDNLEISFRWLAPENTAAELYSLLFCDTLASYTTRAGSIYGRNINLRLACEAINGMVLYPGDVFSYNGALGERTVEKGYQYGISYINGESVPDIGGGICQVSSTLYYCSVIADLKIVERWNHAYASSYTPLGTDATVFWGGCDFKFQNNTEYPIRIEASASYGNVTVKLIGTDTKDYYVKFVSERLDTIPYKTVYKELEPDNEKGYKDGDVITDPYTGYTSKSYRARYDKETNKLIEKVLENSDRYSHRDKVIAKIITPTEPTDPGGSGDPETPTTPPENETEAPETPGSNQETTQGSVSDSTPEQDANDPPPQDPVEE